MTKLVHTITYFQAMETCGSHNLCVGLKAGIKGALHASKRAFGRKKNPNAVSSDSHAEGAKVFDTVWDGGPKSTDPQEE